MAKDPRTEEQRDAGMTHDAWIKWKLKKMKEEARTEEVAALEAPQGTISEEVRIGGEVY